MRTRRARTEQKTARAPAPSPAAPADEPLPPLEATPPSADIPAEELITVVTGLPRSGTSMMMQLLAAGGLPPFTDGLREADESNPRGYLEHEAVKSLARDAAFIAGARGRAVKVVAPLIPFLPSADAGGRPLRYRMIFMRRNLDDVLASQTRMLETGGAIANADAGALARAYHAQLVDARAHLAAHRIPGIDLDYERVCADPAAAARMVRDFLGLPLDLAAMGASVRPRRSDAVASP